MKLLALDTTGEFGSIAFAEDGHVIEEVALHSPEGFAHVLFDQIACLLQRHGLKVGDLEGFAAASGPGSFTGVRVGLTAVKGLAEANARQAVAISNLDALASYGTRPLRAPVIDARRGEIYGGLYDNSLKAVRDEVVMPFEAWFAALPEGDLEIITNGFEVAQARFPVVRAPRALAGAVGRLAAARFKAGLAKDPAGIDANYVRRSDAELLWRDRF